MDGIVDYFQDTNINIFGPNKLASKLEGSKIFTKELCKKYDIPTANFNIFENLKTTELSLKNFKYPLVIKADGLAAGKGVTICSTKQDVIKISNEIFNVKFKSSKKLVI